MIAAAASSPPQKPSQLCAIATAFHAAPAAACVFAAVEKKPSALTGAWTLLDAVECRRLQQCNGRARHVPAHHVQAAAQLPVEAASRLSQAGMRHRVAISSVEPAHFIRRHAPSRGYSAEDRVKGFPQLDGAVQGVRRGCPIAHCTPCRLFRFRCG